MNFYIGKTIDELDLLKDNVYLDEELVEYLYKRRNELDFDIDILYNIPLYEDIIIENASILNLCSILKKILSSNVLYMYEERDEAMNTIKDLIKLFENANDRKMNIISIGD